MDTKQESAHKVNSGGEHSSAAPFGIRTRNLSITSPALLPGSFCTGCNKLIKKYLLLLLLLLFFFFSVLTREKIHLVDVLLFGVCYNNCNQLLSPFTQLAIHCHRQQVTHHEVTLANATALYMRTGELINRISRMNTCRLSISVCLTPRLGFNSK